MTRRITTLAAATMAVGLAIAGCSNATDESDTTTVPAASPMTSTSAAAPATTGQATTEAVPDRAALQALLPEPADTQKTMGPDDIADGGIHLHYQVTGAPNAVMEAYKSALEGQGWTVSTIVTSGGEGGGGATYTGTHGQAYGVFDGGGFADTTYIDVCAWSAKPDNPSCSRGDR